MIANRHLSLVRIMKSCISPMQYIKEIYVKMVVQKQNLVSKRVPQP